MSNLAEIYRGSDEQITFQLLKSDGSVEDVDDINDITCTLKHKHSLEEIAEYLTANVTLNSGDDTIDIFMPGSDTSGEQTGPYVLRVEWDVTNADFPDGTEDSIDEIDIFILKA